MASVSEILSEALGCLDEDNMGAPSGSVVEATQSQPKPPPTSTLPTFAVPSAPGASVIPAAPKATVTHTTATSSISQYEQHSIPSTSGGHSVKRPSDEHDHGHSQSSGSESDCEERPSKRRKRGSVMTLSSVDQTTCVVTTCKNRSRDMSMWRNHKCPTHKGKLQGECDCRFNQAFYLSSMKKLNSLHTAMFYELCWDDTRIQTIDAHWKPSKYHKVCSQHFCQSMENYVYAFPILGLNKTSRRIRLIAKKYGLESLLPKDFDIMELNKNMIVPQVRVLSARIVNSSARQKPFPLKPSRLVGDNEFSNLIYSSDDELYGVSGTAPAPSLEETIKHDPRSKRAFVKTDDRVAKLHSLELQLKQQRINNETIISYAKSMGCTVITVDDPMLKESNFKRMKNRCIVEQCAHRLSTKDVFFSLPKNFEVAMHCIAVSITSVGGQNMHMTKIIESAKRNKWDELMTKDPSDGSTVRILPQASLDECTLYFCHRHLDLKNIDPSETDPMLKIRPMLTVFLPEQKELYSHTGRVAYLLNNRHKMWIDCKMGIETSKIVPGLTRVPTPSDIAKSMESASSYHCAIPDCWSNRPWMSERVQMFPIPNVEREYLRWYQCVLSRLGDVHIPKNGFLCAHHFPDSDFVATIPRTFHTVKKKSGLVKCAVRSCTGTENVFKENGDPLRLVPLPADASSRVRWWSQLTAGDPQFGRFVSSQSIFICERHFVNIMDVASLPSLNLNPPPVTAAAAAAAGATHVAQPHARPPRLNNDQDHQHDRVPTSDVRAADWALPHSGEHTHVLAPGQKWCCAETRAVIAKLNRLMIKSRTLMDLIKALHTKMGVAVPRIADFDEKGDDILMYGKFKSTETSLSIANVFTTLAEAITETQEEVNAMKNDAKAVAGSLGLNLVDALGALGGSFNPLDIDEDDEDEVKPELEPIRKSLDAPPTLEAVVPAEPIEKPDISEETHEKLAEFEENCEKHEIPEKAPENPKYAEEDQKNIEIPENAPEKLTEPEEDLEKPSVPEPEGTPMDTDEQPSTLVEAEEPMEAVSE